MLGVKVFNGNVYVESFGGMSLEGSLDVVLTAR